MIRDDHMVKYFRVTFWSVLVLCVGCVFVFLPSILIPFMDRVYGAYRARALEKKVERLSHESLEWRSAQYEIPRLREDSHLISEDSTMGYIMFAIFLTCVVGPIVFGETQIAMLRNPIYNRPEPEWRRLKVVSEFPSGGIVFLILIFPLMPAFFLVWYWKITRACVAIATNFGSNALLVHARRAKFNSVVILVDLILLPLMKWAARSEPSLQYLGVLVWFLVAFCIYSLFHLLILLHQATKTFKGGSEAKN